MPVSKKKAWGKPTVLNFENADEARAHYASKASAEGLAALDCLIGQSDGTQESQDTPEKDIPGRRYG